jgi:hypothetical protein
MATLQSRLLCTVAFLMVASALHLPTYLYACQRQLDPTFPVFRASRLTPLAAWREATTVVVGNAVRVLPYGTQRVNLRAAWPIGQPVDRLHWCQAQLIPIAVVKGHLQQSPRTLLWASIREKCILPGTPEGSKTKVWLLREELGFLRPVADAGGTRTVWGFRQNWTAPGAGTPEIFLGEMLLKRETYLKEELSDAIWEFGEIACELLGKAACVTRLRHLTAITDSTTAQSICDFLDVELGEGCR